MKMKENFYVQIKLRLALCKMIASYTRTRRVKIELWSTDSNRGISLCMLKDILRKNSRVPIALFGVQR